MDDAKTKLEVQNQELVVLLGVIHHMCQSLHLTRKYDPPFTLWILYELIITK